MRAVHRRLILIVVALVLALTACSNAEPASDTEPAAPVATTPAPGQEGSQSTVATASTDLGEVLVDSAGMTLYLFTPDEQGASTCYDQCAENWPALTVDSDVTVADGLDEATFGTVERDDGSMQVTAGGWPLYTFAGDSAAGEVNGQGVNDVWFVVTPQGEAVRTEAEQG